jgi:hypothetical protein
VQTLNSAKRISANPNAVAYLAKNISFDGELSVPVLTMHTTGDGLVVPENEQAYKAVVDRAGHGALLRQIFVDRAGHCAFTPAETITAVQTLENRLSTGHWNVPSPAAMNAEAAALGAAVQHLLGERHLYPTAPAFTSYTPAPYLRPFDLFFSPSAANCRFRPARIPKSAYLPNGPACLPEVTPGCSPGGLGRAHRGARRGLHERPDLLGDAAPVRGRVTARPAGRTGRG